MMRIGIDATNIGGGGGITHLKEIITHICLKSPNDESDKIIVFSSEFVLNQIPCSGQIEKVTHPLLNKNRMTRVVFQTFCYDKEIKKRCDILFSITGDYTGSFSPVVGMSRNMLLYERNIWKEINQPKEIIRFWLSYMRQKRSFRKSEGVIFISKYAYSVVSEQLNLTGKKIAIIHHGVSDRFKMKVKKQNPIESYSAENPYRLLYVSTVHVYKHQWNVVTAVGNLRKKGYPLELNLVGGIIYKPAGDRLLKTIRQVDPDGRFVHYCNHISYENIEEYYQNTEGVIFASTCENMPNILIESMSSGRPIACSDKQPMPEFLKEDDFRFNSYEIASIENAVEKMILDPELREISATNNLDESIKYSWEKTTQETFQFIKKIYTDYHNNPQNPDCRLS